MSAQVVAASSVTQRSVSVGSVWLFLVNLFPPGDVISVASADMQQVFRKSSLLRDSVELSQIVLYIRM